MAIGNPTSLDAAIDDAMKEKPCWKSNNDLHKKAPVKGLETSHRVFQDYDFYLRLCKEFRRPSVNIHEDWYKQFQYLLRRYRG